MFLTLILWGESTAGEHQYFIGFACQCRGCFRLLDMNPILRVLNTFVPLNGSALTQTVVPYAFHE